MTAACRVEVGSHPLVRPNSHGTRLLLAGVAPELLRRAALDPTYAKRGRDYGAWAGAKALTARRMRSAWPLVPVLANSCDSCVFAVALAMPNVSVAC